MTGALADVWIRPAPKGEDTLKTAVVTDGRYRASIAAVRALGEAGFRVIVTQTKGEAAMEPASFASRFTGETRWIEGSCQEAAYGQRLMDLLKEYDHPVLFCTGADTLHLISRQREEFAQVADFLVAPPQVLDALNDKEQVHQRCLALGIPVPEEYTGLPDRFPVVIKPHCGEKFGLKAKDRYVIARSREDYETHYAAMRRYDASPIVQEKVEGPGEGANLLLDANSRLVCALCHRRLREYPVTGGPSTCCVSFYDENMIRQAHDLLASFGFVGMAMVEFKGGRVLEVNPRVWGSFPMTACCESPFTALYAQAAQGERVDYTPCNYRQGVKMRYLLNDGAATLGYLRQGNLKQALGGVVDFFFTREALYRKDDKKAYQTYLRNSWKGR